MKKWILAVGLVLAAPVAGNAQDAEEGKAVFKKCAACHQIGPAAKAALGPPLTCVVGRAAGSAEGFAGYSDALKNSGITWDDEQLLKWFENDDTLVPGNKMIFPAHVKDETDRQNLLAYIKSECKQ